MTTDSSALKAELQRWEKTARRQIRAQWKEEMSFN